MTNDTGHSGADSTPDSTTDGAVLVVDDSATVRAYHRNVLGVAGFAVREACNGYEALELALAERFALLVVDVNMPVMDGFALVAAIRTQALFPQVPIIMVSSEQDPGDAQEAYRNGANLYMVKPADPAELVLHAQLLTGRIPEPMSSRVGGARPETVPSRRGGARPGGGS